MPNPIPPHRREQVKRREMGRCLRCGGPGSACHHRRGRAVKDQHQHCSCNLVWLCRTCHDWAHAHPFEARAVGLIVSRYESSPGSVTALAHFGPLRLGCDGRFGYDTEWEQAR